MKSLVSVHQLFSDFLFTRLVLEGTSEQAILIPLAGVTQWLEC
jgi:hypothetical protein